MSNIIPVSYAIRHKPTGFFIPIATGFKGRGGSHVEPCDPHEQRPKLFAKKQTAKGWLTTWLKGKLIVKHYTNHQGEEDEAWKTIPVPSRKREEMEIVCIEHSIVHEHSI